MIVNTGIITLSYILYCLQYKNLYDPESQGKATNTKSTPVGLLEATVTLTVTGSRNFSHDAHVFPSHLNHPSP